MVKYRYINVTIAKNHFMIAGTEITYWLIPIIFTILVIALYIRNSKKR